MHPRILSALALLLAALPLAGLAAPHERDSWYIGFGVGTGSGRYSVDGTETTFKEWLSGTSEQMQVSLNFKVGATLTPDWLVGLDITTLSALGTSGGVEGDLSIYNLFLVATWFPQGEGFFLRGGGGRSSINETLTAGPVSITDSEEGTGILLGAGYAWWIGNTLNITANLDFTRQFYDAGTGRPEGSRATLLYIGFDWY